ncbi:sensor histidine kinase [Cellulomonas soli]|uniref:histidine kinase n=1 Tax=Cellulomonas soli TaxID=931535 RepID=A0A512P9B4_9CELL|nr:histidine kinase [Cellulomonas soli]NYI60280.1 signal transduction histidine kinase [Cellulomonas soli]GEP67791.1 hypothetical protein CSO01_05060 [Cellulomonas soli]
MLMSDTAWAVLLSIVSIAYFLVTIAVSTSFFTDNGGPTVSVASVWGTVAVFALQAVPLVRRTRHPVATFWLVYACFLVAVAITVDRNFTITPTYWFAIFTVAACTSRRTWTTTLSIAAGLDFLIHLTLAGIATGGMNALVLLAIVVRVVPTYVAPLLAGLLYGAQQRQAELAAAHAAALRTAADAQAAAAVAAERNRMARELHDVAAHHLSGILLQTRAAIRVHEHDPQTTTELLTSIRNEGELTLRSLREVIGVLRDDDGGPGVREPTLSTLPELIASVRTLHPAIDLAVTGDIDDLSPATSLACYRIIQESLTNARRHAPGGQVTIHVHRRPRELTIEVSNTAATEQPAHEERSRPGYGLVGMRERATMLGGTLHAGTTPDGGWRTSAAIPLDRQLARTVERTVPA